MALVYLGGFFLAVKLTVHSFREHDPVTCWQPRRLLALFFFFFSPEMGEDSGSLRIIDHCIYTPLRYTCPGTTVSVRLIIDRVGLLGAPARRSRLQQLGYIPTYRYGRR